MAVQRRNSRTAGTRTNRPAKAAPARKAAAPARKAAPQSRKADVTEYANKPATGYHKAFAKWIVTEVGFDPDSVSSKRAAFLKGVSIATAARPAFNASDAVEEYREKSGEAKRGPKPATAKAAAPAKSRRRAPEPEPEEVDEDEDFDDEDEDFDDDETDSDEDFDEDDDEESDSDDDEDDEDFDDDEPEEAPAPVRRTKSATRTSRPASGTASTRKGAPAKKAAPAKRTAKPAAEDDDDFLF
jgi:hypothetical protein